jgi:signal transduction histidine kinase
MLTAYGLTLWGFLARLGPSSAPGLANARIWRYSGADALNSTESFQPLNQACTFILALFLACLETLLFAQEPIVIDEDFSFFRAGSRNVSYFHQPETIDWQPIDAIDFFQESDLERKRQKLFAYYDSLYTSIALVDIRDILKPEIRDRFQLLDQDRPNFGFINRPIWYRLKLSYQGREPTKNILINLKGYALDARFFVVENGDSVSAAFRRSLLEPQELKPRLDTGNNTTLALELNSSRKEFELYFMAYSSVVPHHFSIEFHSPEHLETTTASWLPFQWAYAGATAGLLIYNLGVFLVARQKVYLYFVLFIGTNLIMSAELNGFYFNIFTENAAAIWNHVFLLALGLHGIFFLAFAREFLRFSSYHRLNRMTIMVQKITIVAALMSIVGSAELMIPLAIMGIFALVPIVIGPALWLVTKKDRQAIFFMLGISVFMVGSLLRALTMNVFLPDYFILDHILEIGLLIESLILSIAMGDQLRTLNLSLEQYVLKVDSIVDNKTREIRSIMKHINQGIFAILPGFKIHSEYSQQLCTIVGKTDILGSDPVQLLSEGSNLNEDDVARMSAAIDLSLSSPFDFELNENHLPRTMEKHGKSLELDWLVVEDENSQTEKLLVTVIDVTEIKKLRGQADEQAREMSTISEILAVDVETCQHFFDAASRMMADVSTILNSSTPFDERKLKDIFMKYHTMKGHVRSLGFKELTNEIHKAEHVCAQYLSDQNLVSLESLKSDHSKIQSILDSYLSVFRDKLGRSASSSLSLDKESILNLLKIFSHLPPSKRAALIREEATLHYLYYQELKELLHDCCRKAAKVANELGKMDIHITVQCPDVDIPPQTVELLQNTFIHLLRNSVDHGLEFPEVRLSKNKPAQGSIRIKGTIEKESLIITCGDDGEGLNLKRIREKSLEQGIIDDSCQDPHIIASAIFHPGFSTASQVSEISGRGMGLDAVRTLLGDAGAKIALVFSEPQKVTVDSNSVPFLFRIELPGHAWIPGFAQRLAKVPA